MTWKKIKADEMQAGDYIDVNGKLSKIIKVFPTRFTADIDGEECISGRDGSERLGVKFVRKVEGHPHGLIPTEHGVVILIDELVYERCGQRWLGAGIDGSFSHEIVQGRADLHGYTVLWPRPELEITEEMIERAGEALRIWNGDSDDNLTRWAHEEMAEVVLEAALGGEQ